MDWLQQSSQLSLLQSWATYTTGTASHMLAYRDSELDPWLPPSTRVFVLGTLLPTAVVLLTLFYDFLSALPWPKFCQDAWHVFRSPFTDFMGLKDLNGESGPTLVQPAWKTRVLVALSAVEAVAWISALAYDILAGDVARARIVQAGAASLAWVSPRETTGNQRAF